MTLASEIQYVVCRRVLSCRRSPYVLGQLHLLASVDWNLPLPPRDAALSFPARVPGLSLLWLLPPAAPLDFSEVRDGSGLWSLGWVHCSNTAFPPHLLSHALPPRAAAFVSGFCECRVAALQLPGTRRPGTGRSSCPPISSLHQSQPGFLPETCFSGAIYSSLMFLSSCSCAWREKAFAPAHHIFFVVEQHKE